MLEVEGINDVVFSLEAASRRAQYGSYKIIEQGGEKIAATARNLISGLQHAPLYPDSITSEMGVVAGGFEAVIGPDKDKPQGALGNLLEYGSAKNAPLAHLGPSLDLHGPGIADDLGEHATPT